MTVYRTPTNELQKKSGGTSSRIVVITNYVHDTTAACHMDVLVIVHSCGGGDYLAIASA